MLQLTMIMEVKSLRDYVMCVTKLNEEDTFFFSKGGDKNYYFKNQHCLYNFEPSLIYPHNDEIINLYTTFKFWTI